MKLIDIDRIHITDNHIHYINMYEGSAILMNSESRLFRFNINFSVEHKPVGTPAVKVKFIEHPHFPIIGLIKKIKSKILEMDKKGVLIKARKKSK